MASFGGESGDVGVDCYRESVDGQESGVAVELVVEVTEKALYGGVVEAVVFRRHRLQHAAFLAVMPSRLDLQPPRVTVAGLGDRSLRS